MVAAAHPLATLAGVESSSRAGRWWTRGGRQRRACRDPAPHVRLGAISSASITSATGRVHFLRRRRAVGLAGRTRRAGPRGMDRLPVIAPERQRHRRRAGWAMLLERFGPVPLQLLAPAIECAADGFRAPRSSASTSTIPIGDARSQCIDATRPAAGRRAGDLLSSPISPTPCARSAAAGPHVYYEDAWARHRGAAGSRRFVTADDLARTREWGEPISTRYRGVTVYETRRHQAGHAAEPQPARGLPLARHRVHSVEHLHLLHRDG